MHPSIHSSSIKRQLTSIKRQKTNKCNTTTVSTVLLSLSPRPSVRPSVRLLALSPPRPRLAASLAKLQLPKQPPLFLSPRKLIHRPLPIPVHRLLRHHLRRPRHRRRRRRRLAAHAHRPKHGCDTRRIQRTHRRIRARRRTRPSRHPQRRRTTHRTRRGRMDRALQCRRILHHPEVGTGGVAEVPDVVDKVGGRDDAVGACVWWSIGEGEGEARRGEARRIKIRTRCPQQSAPALSLASLSTHQR